MNKVVYHPAFESLFKSYTPGLSEERMKEINEWAHTLSAKQLELLEDLIQDVRTQTDKECYALYGLAPRMDF